MIAPKPQWSQEQKDAIANFAGSLRAILRCDGIAIIAEDGQRVYLHVDREDDDIGKVPAIAAVGSYLRKRMH